MAQAFLNKLRQLPMVDGKPDFSALGDPNEVAKQWAAELKPSHEQLVERFLDHLGANQSD